MNLLRLGQGAVDSIFPYWLLILLGLGFFGLIILGCMVANLIV